MSLTTRRQAGLLLIIAPLLFTICFTLLGLQFEYPDILRQPTGQVLAKFAAGGAPLLASWYVLALTATLFVPLALLVHAALSEGQPSLGLQIATVTGVLAGLVQALGFLRWPFLVPHLASVALDPAASPAQRAAAELIFEAFHRYLGMAVGEHMGYLCTAVWTLLVARELRRQPQWGRWAAPAGALLALGIAAGLLEPAGVAAAGAINAVSYLAWSVWLMVVGALLIVRPSAA